MQIRRLPRDGPPAPSGQDGPVQGQCEVRASFSRPNIVAIVFRDPNKPFVHPL